MTTTSELIQSPFHQGEKAVQERMGVGERMEKFGRQVIRDYMPQQHQEFYRQLPFVFVGHSDSSGWPWASILFGEADFIQSPDDRTLQLKTSPVAGDPLEHVTERGTKIGLLGVELTTRRRNRLSTHLLEQSTGELRLGVDQAFGNCPQYIQTRELVWNESASNPRQQRIDISALDEQACELIQRSDTFFVASSVSTGTGEPGDGADVSHRGGRPGFIRVDSPSTITIPDYLGNNHFNTFGNFELNPRAGLLFIDFDQGHMLTLTGTVEMIWDSPEVTFFEGAQRLWKFHLDHGRWLKHALPFRWKFGDYSPNSLLSGTWNEASKRAEAAKQADTWRSYVVRNVVDESSVVKSFYLEPEGGLVPKFKPGQFLTLKTLINGEQKIRTYTVSSAPADDLVRISIKRETASEPDLPDGQVSGFLHVGLNIGDVIEVKEPRGAFHLDASEERPAVLLAGGIGITPMISMVRHILVEGVRTRHMRQTIVVSSAKNAEQRSFFDELNAIATQSGGSIRHYSLLGKAGDNLKRGVDFHGLGRISRSFLQAILTLDDYDFYLCGPAGYMQSTYDLLRELGVADTRILAESFGPASLQRTAVSQNNLTASLPVAEQAIVQFQSSGVEQAWMPEEGTLLEFAEAHGLAPEYGCRSGQCGACKVRLESGGVTYKASITVELEPDEALLCCAYPAREAENEISKLTLVL